MLLLLVADHYLTHKALKDFFLHLRLLFRDDVVCVCVCVKLLLLLFVSPADHDEHKLVIYGPLSELFEVRIRNFCHSKPKKNFKYLKSMFLFDFDQQRFFFFIIIETPERTLGLLQMRAEQISLSLSLSPCGGEQPLYIHFFKQ